MLPYMAMDFADLIQLYTLTWGDYPRCPGGPSIITKVLNVEEEDRRSQSDAMQEEFDSPLHTLRMEERGHESRNVQPLEAGKRKEMDPTTSLKKKEHSLSDTLTLTQ